MTTMHHSMTGAHARWAVLWVGKKGWVVKEYEHDMEGAIALYMKVRQAKKKGATLLCRNVGFPPPFDRKKMARFNQLGALWCPYCRQMRKFKVRNGYYYEDIWIPGTNTQCPVCGITTENPHVMKHNPALTRGPDEEESNGSPTARAVTRGARGPSKLSDTQRAAKRERARRRREAKRGS